MDGGADLVVEAGALVDLDVVAGAAEGEGCGEAAYAGAYDEDVEGGGGGHGGWFDWGGMGGSGGVVLRVWRGGRFEVGDGDGGENGKTMFKVEL